MSPGAAEGPRPYEDRPRLPPARTRRPAAALSTPPTAEAGLVTLPGGSPRALAGEAHASGLAWLTLSIGAEAVSLAVAVVLRNAGGDGGTALALVLATVAMASVALSAGLRRLHGWARLGTATVLGVIVAAMAVAAPARLRSTLPPEHALGSLVLWGAYAFVAVQTAVARPLRSACSATYARALAASGMRRAGPFETGAAGAVAAVLAVVGAFTAVVLPFALAPRPPDPGRWPADDITRPPDDWPEVPLGDTGLSMRVPGPPGDTTDTTPPAAAGVEGARVLVVVVSPATLRIGWGRRAAAPPTMLDAPLAHRLALGRDPPPDAPSTLTRSRFVAGPGVDATFAGPRARVVRTRVVEAAPWLVWMTWTAAAGEPPDERVVQATFDSLRHAPR